MFFVTKARGKRTSLNVKFISFQALGEAFRKRRYPKNFVSKISDAEAEAAETQVWLDYALACQYITKESYDKLIQQYEYVIGMLVNMRSHPEKWAW